MDRNDIFKCFIMNARTLKELYSGLLMPFFNEKEIRFWRNLLYSLNLEEWKKDRIWEYLNGDVELEILLDIYERDYKTNITSRLDNFN